MAGIDLTRPLKGKDESAEVVYYPTELRCGQVLLEFRLKDGHWAYFVHSRRAVLEWFENVQEAAQADKR